jgi:hypothetical protein
MSIQLLHIIFTIKKILFKPRNGIAVLVFSGDAGFVRDSWRRREDNIIR